MTMRLFSFVISYVVDHPSHHCCHFTLCAIKKGKKETLHFRLNSRNSWSIFIILAPVKTGMNTSQSNVVTYLIAR